MSSASNNLSSGATVSSPGRAPARPRGRASGAPAALQMVEEAIHLLRIAAPGTLWRYYAGALPFVAALLYFWSYMLYANSAAARGTPLALGLALLYLWMKIWQGAFCRRLMTAVQNGGRPAGATSWRDAARTGVFHAIVQPLQLLLPAVPLMMIAAENNVTVGYVMLVVLPWTVVAWGLLVWLYAFCQNLLALAAAGQAAGPLLRQAWRAVFFSVSTHAAALLIVAVLTCVVFINVCIALGLLPYLLRMLTGWETSLTLSVDSLLNTTFFAIAAALTFLCIDPVVKALYVLRCFYGQAQFTGQDLLAQIRRHVLRRGAPLLVAAAAALAVSLAAAPACGMGETGATHNPVVRVPDREGLRPGGMGETCPLGTPTPSESGKAASRADQLDQSIDKTLQRSEYDWRSANEDKADKSKAASFFGWLTEKTNGFFQAVRDLWKEFRQWLRELMEEEPARRPKDSPSGDSGSSSFGSGAGIGGGSIIIKLLLYVALAVVAAAVIVLAVKLILARRKKSDDDADAPAAGSEPAPDVADETVTADALTEDGWMTMAGELLARGELRLALRAMYLASLKQLAQRGLIRIQKFKSNRDYRRELQRREHVAGELLGAFAENVNLFEYTWYGLHDVSDTILNSFTANQERMRSHVEV
ncbi:MAG: hypothetical protein LLG01_10405 [Planctomycetaceae bacterium]|nr:hypothetical protein [Planctomycetaceae bacterium]